MKIQLWKQVDVKTVGTSHISKNIPCQDSTHYLFKNGVKVMALADGAGSRKLSHIGSEIVVTSICDFISQNFESFFIKLENHDDKINNNIEVKKKIVDHVQKKLFDYASNNNNTDVDALASTLLFFAFSKDRYILGHIGDGIIGTLKQSDVNYEIETASFPENGNAANITFFVTNQDVLKHIRITAGYNKMLNGIVLMSDGPEEAFFDTFNGLNSNTIKLFTNFNKISELKYKEILEKLLIEKISKVSDDDLSLNLAFLDNRHISPEKIREVEHKLDKIKEPQCLTRVSSDVYKFDETFILNYENTEVLLEIKAGLES